MLEYVVTAIEHFSQHQMRETAKKVATFNATNSISTSIDISIDNALIKIHLTYDAALVQKIAKIYLDEDTSSQETLQEMALETTNMIAGSAKTLAQEADIHFNITTPFLESSFTTDGALVVDINTTPALARIEEVR